jgi:hypothetical protein
VTDEKYSWQKICVLKSNLKVIVKSSETSLWLNIHPSNMKLESKSYNRQLYRWTLITVFRYTFLNVQKPTKFTLLFLFFRPFVTPSINDSNAAFATTFEIPASYAIFSI